MNTRPLVEALLSAAFFLENSPDDVVDPDAAVGALEDIAASLGQTPADDVPELLAVFEAIAADAKEPHDRGWAQFVRLAPYAFGLVDEEPQEMA